MSIPQIPDPSDVALQYFQDQVPPSPPPNPFDDVLQHFQDQVSPPQVAQQAQTPVPRGQIGAPDPSQPAQTQPVMPTASPSAQFAQTDQGAIPRHPISAETPSIMETDPGVHSAPYFSSAENGIKNPVLRNLAKFGDVAGSIILPRQTAMIPGTRGNEIMRQEQGQKEAMGRAQIQHEEEGTAQELAAAQKDLTPMEDWKVEPQYTGPNGEPVEVNAKTGEMRVAGQTIPGIKLAAPKAAEMPADEAAFQAEYLKNNPSATQAEMQKAFVANKQTPEKPPQLPAEMQQFSDDYQKHHPNASVAEVQKAYHENIEKPPALPKQMAVAPDGTVVELTPGSKVPTGSKTVQNYEGGGTADEKRRSDLANNLNENLTQLEDILTRRPELFGPLSGRITEAKGLIGTSDPDVAALHTIKEQMGLAMVGAHAMRNANHVETAANSIINSFHNNPDAIRGAIKTARASVDTFLSDVGKPAAEPKSAGEKAASKILVEGKDF